MIAVHSDKDSVEIMETEDDRSMSMTLTWERASDLQSALAHAINKHNKQEEALAAK